MSSQRKTVNRPNQNIEREVAALRAILAETDPMTASVATLEIPRKADSPPQSDDDVPPTNPVVR
jgi:hypothetical protein